MFQNIRQNSQVYILHKEGVPRLEIGNVINVSAPVPKYPLSPQTMYGQPQEMVVDVVVRIGNNDVTYQKIPANADVADFGLGVVLFDNREAVSNEVATIRSQKEDSISENSIRLCREAITACDSIQRQLNPEYAERQKQKDEISDMKAEMAELKKIMLSFTETLKEK